MLIENELFPQQAVEQTDEKESVRRVGGMDHIETTLEEHLPAQAEGHHQSNDIFYNIADIFVIDNGQMIAIDVDVINAGIGLSLILAPFGADYAHLVAVIA